MPRATLCGLSSRFVLREVILPRLSYPAKAGGEAAARFGWVETIEGLSPLVKKHAFLPHKVAADEPKCG
jgi:hypothetical protein